MRSINTFHIADKEIFNTRLFQWSKQFNEVVFLDSCNHSQNYGKYDAVMAIDAFTALKTDYHNAFNQLEEYQKTTKDWLFGYLSYDLKNDTEDLRSNNFDGLHFPDLYFFQPQKIIFVKNNTVEFHYLNMVEEEAESDFEQINNTVIDKVSLHENENQPRVQPRISKEKYIKSVNEMLQYISRGDIYEANFCQEFYAENYEIDIFESYKALQKISSPPFSVFLKLEEYNLICASPERYLQKTNQKLISQPIKGTARRSQNIQEDFEIAKKLAVDEKERSENIMIVDLVRNDLSKFAKKGSVKVEELCKVYTFKQVHHLISTISAVVEDVVSPVDVIRATFPMGSMTGAPKISAMKIIEELETTKRGVYSGAVGYFTPTGDFDFNVVIRSILYNAKNKYVSFSVGGAITANSVPNLEYEECLLKANAMLKVLNSSTP